jgi:predicted glycoside hydrolase/deacetylase ChbG (UPF0249 family)
MPARSGGHGPCLVVNADDFGMSTSINSGIIEAHERGIVTSASLMVRWPAAEAAAAYARQHPDLGVGLHVDLGEWVCDGERWKPRYERVRLNDASAVSREIEAQLALFQRLVGRNPSHLDSHQDVHRRASVRPIVVQLARRLEVPLWGWTRDVSHHGGFYGQTSAGEPLPEAIGVEALLSIVDALEPGVTVMRCHPGGAPETESSYREERVTETRSLCDPRVLEAVRSRGITLCSFADRSLLP